MRDGLIPARVAAGPEEALAIVRNHIASVE